MHTTLVHVPFTKTECWKSKSKCTFPCLRCLLIACWLIQQFHLFEFRCVCKLCTCLIACPVVFIKPGCMVPVQLSLLRCISQLFCRALCTSQMWLFIAIQYRMFSMPCTADTHQLHLQHGMVVENIENDRNVRNLTDVGEGSRNWTKVGKSQGKSCQGKVFIANFMLLSSCGVILTFVGLCQLFKRFCCLLNHYKHPQNMQWRL